MEHAMYIPVSIQHLHSETIPLKSSVARPPLLPLFRLVAPFPWDKNTLSYQFIVRSAITDLKKSLGRQKKSS